MQNVSGKNSKQALHAKQTGKKKQWYDLELL